MASSKFDLALPAPSPEGGLSAAALSLKMAARAKKFSTMLRDRTALRWDFWALCGCLASVYSELRFEQSGWLRANLSLSVRSTNS